LAYRSTAWQLRAERLAAEILSCGAAAPERAIPLAVRLSLFGKAPAADWAELAALEWQEGGVLAWRRAGPDGPLTDPGIRAAPRGPLVKAAKKLNHWAGRLVIAPALQDHRLGVG